MNPKFLWLFHILILGRVYNFNLKLWEKNWKNCKNCLKNCKILTKKNWKKKWRWIRIRIKKKLRLIFYHVWGSILCIDINERNCFQHLRTHCSCTSIKIAYARPLTPTRWFNNWSFYNFWLVIKNSRGMGIIKK